MAKIIDAESARPNNPLERGSMATPTIGPAPMFPERVTAVYERKMGPNQAGQRGPLRFEEGVATDTDVPNDFQVGMAQGYGSGARPNQNMNVYEKWPEETMKERAHVGSASWVEAPTYLGEFAHGSYSDLAEVRYEEVIRNGARQERTNPATVND